MNIANTKVMVVDNTPIKVNNMMIDNVEGYVYLGQRYSLKEKKTKRYNEDSWQAGRHMYQTPGYRTCVLPAMTYAVADP